MINDDFVKYEDNKRDEYIRLDTTIIGIDNLIAKASTAEEANALFKAKDVIYSQQQNEQKALDEAGQADELRQLLREVLPILRWAFFANFRHQERCDEVYAKIKEAVEALKDTSVSVGNDTIKLRKGVKKFRAENYVIYDVNYLLENLAKEIFLLYQTGKDFSKPVFNIDNIRRMFVDYAPCEKCTNPDTYGTICVKCGACGRKFDDKGVLIDNE